MSHKINDFEDEEAKRKGGGGGMQRANGERALI